MSESGGQPTVTEILTPHDSGMAVELANGLWRKQILPVRKITYTDSKTGAKRAINFDAAYLKDLHNSFQARAFDQVAAQLANSRNEHTNDVRDTGGELVSTELAADGLYGIFRMNDAGAAVVRANPKVGVSARIIEGLDRSDGKRFDRAMQHVLLTLDPQIPGLAPWQAADNVTLSSGSPDVTIDLSSTDYTEDAVTEQDEGQVSVSLSKAQLDRLQLLLNDDDAAAKALAGVVEASVVETKTEDDGAEGDSSVELARNDAAMGELRGEVELANSRVLEMSRQMAAQQLNAEVEKLAMEGLAPALIEAAKPLLAAQPGAVELSNGTSQIDLGKAVRDILKTVVDLDRQGVAVVQLNREDGFLLTSDEADPIRQQRETKLSAWSEAYGN
jgi:hypothetical protein